MSEVFRITRADGRSNAQVVLDFVQDGKPGTIYSYKALGAALEKGTSEKYGAAAVQRVVNSLHSRLAKEQQRTFVTVRGLGYRLAHANEHSLVAHNRHRKADAQFRKGIAVLRHVKWDELDEASRQAHQGHLMISEALFANQQALNKRVASVEAAIKAMRKKDG